MIPLIASLFLLPIGIPTMQYTEPLVIEQPIECSCVQTARKYASVDIPRQDADQFKPNSKPVEGGLILLKYEDVSHVAVVEFILKGGVYIREGNYRRCRETERFVAFDDPHVVGYWTDPLQVAGNF